jgi:hypothetical protein
VADVFDEVEEQLRSERYKTIALKSLPWVGALALIAILVTGGFWGWQTYQDKAAAKASEQYAQALKSFDEGKTEQAVAAWTEVAKSPAKAYKSMALMQLGGVKLTDNKTADAVKFFDDAAKAAPDDVIGDVARLKSAFALLDTAPYKDLETRLTPMTEEGRPYRAAAREALAFAKIMAGDLKGARDEFKVLTLLPDSSQGLRGRAQAALELIDSGSAKAVPEIAKAAAALPPPKELPPGATPFGPPPSAPQPQATGPQ